VQVDRSYSSIRKRAKFGRLADSIMVGVVPQQQSMKYRISRVNQTVTIATVFWPVEFRQCRKSVLMLAFWRRRLRCGIAKKFRPIIYDPIAIAIKS
jgi:hypothetical protein